MIEIRAANPWTCLSEGRRFFWVRYMRPPKSGSVARVPPPNLLSECGCCLLDPCVLCCKPSGHESEAVVYIEGICLPEVCDKPPPLFFPHTIQPLQHLEFTSKLMPWWAHPWAIPRLRLCLHRCCVASDHWIRPRTSGTPRRPRRLGGSQAGSRLCATSHGSRCVTHYCYGYGRPSSHKGVKEAEGVRQLLHQHLPGTWRSSEQGGAAL